MTEVLDAYPPPTTTPTPRSNAKSQIRDGAAGAARGDPPGPTTPGRRISPVALRDLGLAL